MSEQDAGLLLSAEERKFVHALHATPINPTADGCPLCVVEVRVLTRIFAARVEAARVEERERIAATIKAEKKNPGVSRTDYGQGYAEGTKDALDAAIRIARTPPPTGDAQGPQDARNGPVSDEEAGDGRGHGRDDESGRGDAR